MPVEVLYFGGCPGHERVLPLVRRLAGQAGAKVALRRVETPEDADAERVPRVADGARRRRRRRPGAAEREDFGLKCRIYQAPDGLSVVPAERWLHEALAWRPRR